MYFSAPRADIHSTTSSGTTTPVSDRSSLSTGSSASSVSGTSRQYRSSLKSSLKSSPVLESKSERRSSPPTVRFAEPERPTRPKSLAPRYQQRRSQAYSNGIPNPLLQYQHRPGSMVANPASSRFSVGPQAYSTLPPHIMPTPHAGQIQYKKARPSQRFSAPVQPSQSGPRRLSARPSADFTPPSLALEHRVSSFQSVSSNQSVQSAPAELQTPLPSSLPGPHNPIEHYVPCLHQECTVHFSSTNLGPTYYISQGPYSLSKHHGYCPQHASKELKGANAWCKQNWESLRQNAGRKTLGQIASEFDVFLDTFRQNRRVEDAELRQRQKRIILGNESSKDEDTEWKWNYTPRHCTRASCPSARYSPYANHLYAFYHSRRSSTLTALPTLCPPCARNEMEAFERMVTEKWMSRTGWDEREWNYWFGAVMQDRDMGREFWEKAQEREVKERQTGQEEGVGKETMDKGEDGVVEKLIAKKKSVFKRLFGGGKGGE
ncbi:hypothetical protein DE146DRAFT_619701 [Phaeosphaeria sp. MPI-PUGE-AT-0046c]|nr:hypothetical protein DE146DRAFT_619701 [Phaeosphaeria sp. MPI-PUGE-AT-0046c]